MLTLNVRSIKSMGFFKNLIGKAKGVLGRVVDVGKKIVPKIGGVLGKVADYTGIPYLKWMSKAWNIGKGIYDTIKGSGSLKDKIKDVSSDIGEAVDHIKNRPTINEGLLQPTKDFVHDEAYKRIPEIAKLTYGT